ncbi:hypothetical protein LCGC14_1334960 [marine sediment metagenome]|uniref:ParB-like N-terminal domain-containing protein n=1 Tax=marine sediment metagenome TaxID=412755 RepID=A0A0F9NHX7_9ZZZZ
MQKTLKVLDVIYREDLYPRSLTTPERVQDYAENLEMLPPIEINQQNILIDGWHRWTAHKKNGVSEINATVTETSSDAELLEFAIIRNSVHGLQLSMQDKKDNARKIYHITPNKDRSKKKGELARILPVTLKTIQRWLSRIDKDTREQQKKRVSDLWLACYTQQEIAEAVGVPQQTVQGFIPKKDNCPISVKFTFSDDFDLPVYNVWKVQNKSNTVSHFGNTEKQWLDNLLYLYTKPFDIIMDPFAGGGSTIDVCKYRGRRYFVSDRKPIVEREHEIRMHDIVDELPKPPMWEDVSLVYLDPPYWKQSEGAYSDSLNDLSNMTLENFNKTLSNLITQFAKKLKSGSHIALIIQPTQWRAPKRHYTDHVADMIKAVKLPINMRIQAPYESQQANAQMVDWAKENKTLLVLSREIVVWEVV